MRVVAAAVVRDGRVLAARRSRPPALAGGWEFPGGKVEDGESDARALVRELREELDVQVAVGPVLGAARDGDLELVLLAASVRAGEPVAGDSHDALRWLGVGELTDVPWLPVDLRLLDTVRPLLAAPAP